MRRLSFAAFALPLFATACAPLADPVPVEAILTRDLLRVTMSDGHHCLGLRPAMAGPAGWSGQLQGCTVAYPYDVRLDPHPNPLQQAVAAIDSALTLDGIFTVPATVEVYGPAGRTHVFASPPDLGD